MKKLKRPKRTDTKVYQQKQIKKQRNKCSKLWRTVVLLLADGHCWYPDCEITKGLNAHHIEDFRMNPIVRFDPKNGLCCCAGHHKFKKGAVHKGFVAVYRYLIQNRPMDIMYLEDRCAIEFTSENLTKEYLENQILILQGMVEGLLRK